MPWFTVFILLVLAHLAEHVVQVYQLYVLGLPMHEARGILGQQFPWLMHSETLHFWYAVLIFAGLWHFRKFVGSCGNRAGFWWRVALYIQGWHLFEHVLLYGQAIAGHNFFGAAQPLSVIQFLGFLNGTPEDGFGGLLKMSHFGECDCPGAKPGTFHTWTPWLLVIRRPEVHAMYNLAVFIPMWIAMSEASAWIESRRKLLASLPTLYIGPVERIDGG